MIPSRLAELDAAAAPSVATRAYAAAVDLAPYLHGAHGGRVALRTALHPDVHAPQEVSVSPDHAPADIMNHVPGRTAPGAVG